MRIDFLGLEAFLSIADHGSFHRAAANLNLSQTALSHRMKKLEDDLGVKLLTRTTRHVALTPAGVELLPNARRVMADISVSFDDLRRQGRARQETLVIGCLPTIAVHYLPPLLGRLRKSFPDLNIRVLDNSKLEIAEKVHSGEAEFGITIVSADRWDLDITPLMKEPFVLICPKAHALAAQKSVSWSSLLGEPLVRVSTQTGNRQIIDDALGSRREDMTWRYEVQHVVSAVGLVRAGLGLAVVPQLAVNPADSPGVVIVPLRNPGISRTLGVVARRGVPLSPAADALLGLLRRHGKGG
jgi:DNA-binding transcriptional LysR family regulator